MTPGVIRHGIDELKRRWERYTLRKRLTSHDRARATHLGHLGQRAVAEGVDLSSHAALREQIAGLAGKAGGLAESTKALETERQRLQDHRRAEDGRFDGQRSAIHAQKTPVDAALAAARQRLAANESNARNLQSRLAALARELDQHRGTIASSGAGGPADAAARIATAQARVTELEVEQPRIAEELRTTAAAQAPLANEVATHLAESKTLSAQLDEIAAARKKALDEIDAALHRTATQLQATTKDAKGVEEERSARLVDLGTVLYQARNPDPRLAPQISAVAAEDHRRAQTQASLDASLAETRAMPPHAVGRFAAVVLAALLVVVAVPAAGYSYWQRWSAERAERLADQEYESQVDPPSINPFLEHDLKGDRAYMLANRLTDARTDEEAQQILLDVFRAIGLGVYRGDGSRVLAGAQDFFLYDFQWRVLAHTEIVPSYLEFRDFAYIVGGTIAELDPPQTMEPILAGGIRKRYLQARDNPADPNSFIVLFLDGLARRQPVPYSLEGMSANDASSYPISPVQSILLLMEFFMKPAPPERAWLDPSTWQVMPTAHAQEGIVGWATAQCRDLIESEQGRKNYGRGLTVLGEAAEEAFGLGYLKLGTQALRDNITRGAILFDNVTGTLGAAFDLLLLYGININVQPYPYTMHLQHTPPGKTRIEAEVYFDPQLLDQDVVRCGWLIGKIMPEKGPLPKVEVSWRFSRPLPPYLEMHPDARTSKVSPITASGSEGLKNMTNEKGIAEFPIQPNLCVDREGRLMRQDYLAIVSARYLTLADQALYPTPTLVEGPDFGPRASSLPIRRPTIQATLPRILIKFGPGMLEYVMGGRKGYAEFRAEWHKKRPREPQYGS